MLNAETMDSGSTGVPYSALFQWHQSGEQVRPISSDAAIKVCLFHIIGSAFNQVAAEILLSRGALFVELQMKFVRKL